MHVETTTWSPAEGWHDELPTLDGRPALVVVAADPAVACHPAKPLHDVAARFDGHAVVGLSTTAHATTRDLDDRALLDHGISVAVIHFERTTVRWRHHDVSRCGGARRTGRHLATDLADPDLRGLLVFGDARAVNPSSLLRGIGDILPGVDVIGAMARSRSWTLVDGRPRTGAISAVGLIGDSILLGTGTASGWEPDGPTRLVTSSYGDVVWSVDDAPFVDIFGDGRRGDLRIHHRAASTPIVVRDLDDRPITRAVVEIDDRTGAVRCGGDVPQGSEIQFLRAEAELLVDAARLAAKQAVSGREQFALVCTGAHRGRVLADRSLDESRAVADVLDAGCEMLTLRTDAELVTPAPVFGEDDGAHNASITVATISESLT